MLFLTDSTEESVNLFIYRFLSLSFDWLLYISGIVSTFIMLFCDICPLFFIRFFAKIVFLSDSYISLFLNPNRENFSNKAKLIGKYFICLIWISINFFKVSSNNRLLYETKQLVWLFLYILLTNTEILVNRIKIKILMHIWLITKEYWLESININKKHYKWKYIQNYSDLNFCLKSSKQLSCK